MSKKVPAMIKDAASQRAHLAAVGAPSLSASLRDQSDRV